MQVVSPRLTEEVKLYVVSQPRYRTLGRKSRVWCEDVLVTHHSDGMNRFD